MKIVFLIIFFISLVNSTTLNRPTQISDQLKKAIELIKDKKSLDNAHKILLNLSNNGDLEASYVLAKFYLSKITSYHNEIEAYNLIVKTANKNHNKSQLLLGKFLLHGKVVNKDYEKAIYYFKEASKQKLYEANCYIAYMYASGKGVFPNFGRAHVFAKDEYKRGNKLCKKVWKDYNLAKYPKDNSWKIGDYLKPIK